MLRPDEGFDILVNGVPRTFRDTKDLALDACRVLKRRNLADEITVIDRDSRAWAIVADVAAVGVKWQPAVSAAARPESPA